MSKDTSPAAGSEELRKQLEEAGLYDALVYLHEQKHTDDCFCTTEISGAYRKILSIIAAQNDATYAAVMEVLNRSTMSVKCHSEVCEEGQVSQYDGEYYIDCTVCGGSGIVYVINATDLRQTIAQIFNKQPDSPAGASNVMESK